jgi:hypothetical protein
METGEGDREVKEPKAADEITSECVHRGHPLVSAQTEWADSQIPLPERYGACAGGGSVIIRRWVQRRSPSLNQRLQCEPRRLPSRVVDETLVRL